MILQKKKKIQMTARTCREDRRTVAILHQANSLTLRQIQQHGFSFNFVRRWMNVPMTGDDSLFSDAIRIGRPLKYDKKLRLKVAKHLERDSRNILRTTAEDYDISLSTVHRIAKDLAPLTDCLQEVVISPEIEIKRVTFASCFLNVDPRIIGWLDHTLVSVPPKSTRGKVYRTHNSKKAVPKKPKYKHSTNFLVYLGACVTGVSPPVCAVRKRRRKKRRQGERTLGYMWETQRVRECDVRRDLNNVMFPWFRTQGVKILLLDNASVQDQLGEFICEAGFQSPGFASQRVNDMGGFPPNSPDFMLLDAVVNNVFKRDWARLFPMTLCEGVHAAQKIVTTLNDTNICTKYVENFPKLCHEVIASGGKASHYMN